MSRGLRIEFPGAIYHAMARGVARMPVFLDDNDRVSLLQEIEAHVRLGVLVVHAVCLMLNLIHILCETPYAGLGRIMHDILGNYASRYNSLHDRVGHLWQGRYKAILVQDGEYLLRCSRYIHLNPFKAGIDTTDFLYPWSSYRTFVGDTSLIPWVRTDRILSYFGCPEKYKQFLQEGIEHEENPFELATAGIIYGDPEFVKQIRRRLKQKMLLDVPALRLLQRVGPVPSLEAVHSAVKAAFAGASRCQIRRFVVWALHSYTWMKGSEIARAVGLKRSAVSETLRTIELARLSDGKVAERFAAVAERLQCCSEDVSLPFRQITLN